jgi:hypothetical protein
MKKVPFCCSQMPSFTRAIISLPMHDIGNFNTMEGYPTKGFHMGTNNHSAELSTYQALRTWMIFKGEVMLGS